MFPSVTLLSLDLWQSGAVSRSKAALEAPEVVEQLEQLLAASNFDASSRGRAILRFMLGEMRANRQENLSLATIARQVFRRGADFASSLDPAVRIEIARVRRALDRHYRLSGATDPIQISLPRDAFVPVARRVDGRSRPPFEVAPRTFPRP